MRHEGAVAEALRLRAQCLSLRHCAECLLTGGGGLSVVAGPGREQGRTGVQTAEFVTHQGGEGGAVVVGGEQVGGEPRR